MTAELSPSCRSAATTPTSPITEPGTSSACLLCRQRHLKCDGKRPCKRCADSDSNCIFVPSRRGQRIQPRGGASQCIATHELESLPRIKRTQNDAGLFLASECRRKSSFRSFTPPSTSRSPVEWAKVGSGPPLAGPQYQLHAHPATATFERCISSYYHNFHASHPLVLPQAKLLPLIKEGEEALQPLLAVMHWVGSKYIFPETEQRPLLDIARSAVDEAQERAAANGFTVQAMGVMLVALDGSGHAQQAVDLLIRAKEMLLSLGMNYQSFSKNAKTRSRALDESWRRTWWELYVLDGMFAGAHRATSFSLFDVFTDVGLPCEEDEYETDQIPDPPRTLDELNDRDLAMDKHQFSSFAYRILSAKNLGHVIHGYDAAELDANAHAHLEVLLSSWRHNLPPSKRDSLRRDGRPDEMVFQAHMLNHTTSILLHRPRAQQLDPTPARTIDACAPPPSSDSSSSSSSSEPSYPPPPPPPQRRAAVSLHTRHVLDAANELGKMMTHRTPLTLHTHFFICAVVLASIVQLGAWSVSGNDGGGDDDNTAAREQVRLCIGALRQMSTVWGLAGTALAQVREVAGHVHFVRTQSRQMEQFLVHVTDEDVLSMFAADTAALADMETV